MKYPKTKKNSRGVSIIEIVVSMVLLMLVLLALAFVYPNGRKVTQSSDNRTKATQIAKSILEEIELIPLKNEGKVDNTVSLQNLYVLGIPSNEFTLGELSGSKTDMSKDNIRWPFHHLALSGWDAGANETADAPPVCPFFITDASDVNGLKTAFLGNLNRPYCLATRKVGDTTVGIIPKGIVVTPPDPGESGDIDINTFGTNNRPLLATITVSIGWGAKRAGSWHFSSVSLMNTRTENVY